MFDPVCACVACRDPKLNAIQERGVPDGRHRLLSYDAELRRWPSPRLKLLAGSSHGTSGRLAHDIHPAVLIGLFNAGFRRRASKRYPRVSGQSRSHEEKGSLHRRLEDAAQNLWLLVRRMKGPVSTHKRCSCVQRRASARPERLSHDGKMGKRL